MSEEKTIRIIEFDGTESKWVEWCDKFYAKCVILEVDEVLDGTISIPSDNTPHDELGDEEKLAKRKNRVAYGQLSLSCIGVAHGIIRDAKTKENPKGDAKLAWDLLNKKYQSKEADMEVNLETMFNTCAPKDGTEDPDKWFQRLNHLRRRLDEIGKTKDDNSVISVILSHLPDEYASVRQWARKEARNKLLTLDDLMADIQSIYRTEINDIKTYEFGADSPDDNTDKAMSASTNRSGRKKYDGNCGNCGKYGHKTEDCFSNPKSKNYQGEQVIKGGSTNEQKKGPIICHYCNKPGHIAPHCRLKKKRNGGDGGQNSGQSGNSVSNNNTNQMTMFCGYLASNPDLNDSTPHVEKWLLDSGATKHMTPTTDMLHNLTKINDKVQIGDKKYLQATHKGSVVLDLGNNTKMTLSEVLVVPRLSKNLISEAVLQK